MSKSESELGDALVALSQIAASDYEVTGDISAYHTLLFAAAVNLVAIVDILRDKGAITARDYSFYAGVLADESITLARHLDEATPSRET